MATIKQSPEWGLRNKQKLRCVFAALMVVFGMEDYLDQKEEIHDSV